MAAGTVLSRILGFIRAVMLAAMIGVTTNAADAFGVANQLPNNVYAIIVGGVLNAVLVPQIVRARKHQDGGKGYIDKLVTLAIVVFAVVTVAATVSAPLLVQLYTSNWSADQLALATAFAYWCLPQLFFYGLYSMLGEVLNARSAFGPFMWAPVLNNLVSIAGLGFFVWLFGLDPTGTRPVSAWGFDQISLLAGSATLGVAAQALILFASWKRIGLRFKLNFKWRGFGLRPAMKAASWTLGMVLVTQIGGLVQTSVASRVAAERADSLSIPGIAAASIAWLIFMLPHSVATVSIATARFTDLARHAHDENWDAFKADLGRALKAIAFIAAFATAALLVLAYPVARVFVGEFAATAALGQVLAAFVVGLLPFSFVYMMQRAYFALEDTRTPFFFTTIQIGLHIAGSLTLAVTSPVENLVERLAYLTSFTVLVQAILAWMLLRRRIGTLRESGILGSTAVYALVAAVSGGIGWLTLQWFGGNSEGAWSLESVGTSIVTCGVVALVMAAVYLGLLRVIRGIPSL